MMNIEEKIDKYLSEKTDRKTAFDMVVKSIKSTKTTGQLKTAKQMAANFIKMYGENVWDTFWTEFSGGASWMKGRREKELVNIASFQSDKLKHLKNIKK